MTGVQRENMQWWDTISDQWIWIIAAGIFVVFVAAWAAYSLNKPKQHDKTKSNAVAQNGWTPTGRIDFVEPQSNWRLRPSHRLRRVLIKYRVNAFAKPRTRTSLIDRFLPLKGFYPLTPVVFARLTAAINLYVDFNWVDHGVLRH